jgi:hypothetical protein
MSKDKHEKDMKARGKLNHDWDKRMKRSDRDRAKMLKKRRKRTAKSVKKIIKDANRDKSSDVGCLGRLLPHQVRALFT